MDKIKIYTDGSHQGKKAGISFLIINSDKNKVLGYTNLRCKKNIQAELQAIIHALEFLLSTDMSFETIEIGTDESSVVEIFNKRIYKIWDENQWKKENGSTVIRCAKEWFTLVCHIKHFEDKIYFTKVSKEDSLNRIVHRYANHARKLQFCNKNSIHIMESIDDEDFVYKGIMNNSNNKKIEEILSMEKPWKYNKNKADFKWYIEGQHEIVYIDTHDIIITEEVHLNCSSLNFGTLFRSTAESLKISYPIAVKPLGSGKYALVVGITRLITAKLFNIPRIPCVITDLSNKEFLQQKLISIEGNNYR